MIQLSKIVLRMLPWLIVVGLLSWTLVSEKYGSMVIEGGQETHHSVLLTRVEQIGKIELVQYNFQEVTEVKKISDIIDFKLFKYKPVPDAKAVLISQGSATGCIDLRKLNAQRFYEDNDTLYIILPDPELCNFKLDLEKSRMYDLQIDYINADDKKSFVQELYRVAETQIREAALNSGILEQTKDNAQLILKPMLENIAGKKVVL